MDALNHIRFSVYRLTLEAQERIELVRLNRGITLRGAFGTVFRRLVCHDLKAQCGPSCPLHPSCPYGFIFSPTVPPDAERLRLNRDIPRPFVIKPPLDGDGAYAPGDHLCFDLVVVGRAQDFLPYFIVTFEEMGRQGIGIRRGRYKLDSLESLGRDGSWHKVFHREDRMVTPPAESLTGSVSGEHFDGLSSLTLRFLTPVLLKDGGRWVKPEFGPLVKRLRDRLNALSYFYCGNPLEMDFKVLGEKADKISMIRESLRWTEEKRFSKHRDLQHVLKGFIGEVEFGGNVTPFMPLLRLGEVLHVGKATAFGQGWYRIAVGDQRSAISNQDQ
jgi:CRISPR-associated endoribonuclease Cas6